MKPIQNDIKKEYENALEVTHLTVEFGSFKAVNDISFSVKRGEIFGFLGANGAGKTTVIRVLCGILIPAIGEVTVAGIPLNAQNETAIKRSVGYMSQKFTLYNDLSVDENLNFIAALRKLDPAKYRQRREELLRFISFDTQQNTLVRNLSGGLKQKVALAAALLHNPDVIFLDEPTAGVSPASRAVFWELIRQLSDLGKTIFITSHYMDEVEKCNRIALMRAGELIALDSPSGLKTSAFPMPIYELTPTSDCTPIDQSDWKNHPAFDLFDPHGRRYHITVKSEPDWQRFQSTYLEKVRIQKIDPSLEDVFIKLVEGKDR